MIHTSTPFHSILDWTVSQTKSAMSEVDIKRSFSTSALIIQSPTRNGGVCVVDRRQWQG